MQLKYRGQSYSPCHTAQNESQTMNLQFLGQSYQAKGSLRTARKQEQKTVLRFLGRSYAMA